MLYKISHFMDKSRRDNTLLTVGFNLRKESSTHKVPQGRHLRINKVPSLRDLLLRLVRYRRLKPTVNDVQSLRDLLSFLQNNYRLFIFHSLTLNIGCETL